MLRAPQARLIEETTFWWSKEFYTSPKTKGFHMEAKLGGKMYEDWGNGAGVIWYEVFAIDSSVPLHRLGKRTFRHKKKTKRDAVSGFLRTAEGSA